jgi:basic membrane protein A
MFKKGILPPALALVTLLLLSCGASNKVVNDNVTMVHITEAGGIDDNSFNASAWLGITRFYQERDITTGFSYLSVADNTAMESTIALATDMGTNLVSAAGFNFIDSMERVAARYPQQNYLLIDGGGFSLPNVKIALFAEEQAGFLVGYLAALKAQEMNVQNPVFGFIGGMVGSVITRFEMGYIQGVKTLLPNATLLSYYADSWADPAKAKITTDQWLQTYPSLFAVFSAAGPTGNGTVAQIKEARLVGRNVWAIGVDSDQYESGFINATENVVLTSALKRVDTVLYETLTELEQGFFTPGVSRFDLHNNGVGYSQSHEVVQTPHITTAMAQMMTAIADGTQKVWATRAETELAGFISHDTRAQD